MRSDVRILPRDSFKSTVFIFIQPCCKETRNEHLVANVQSFNLNLRSKYSITFTEYSSSSLQITSEFFVSYWRQVNSIAFISNMPRKTFLRSISNVLIGYQWPINGSFTFQQTHKASMTSQVPSRALGDSYLWEQQGIFFSNQTWFTVPRSIVTTMEKRLSRWASSNFLLMKNTARSGKRKSVAWTGSLTSTQGCVRPILNLIAFFTTTNFLTRLACQGRKKQRWSTMQFQPSLITKTERLNQQVIKSCRVNENMRNRVAKCTGREGRSSR